MTFEEAIREADREWEERVIPNGKTMDWNGHKLRFEFDPSKCVGCFFDDKEECPYCDDGIWVEDNPNPWHTGTPTEDGWYVVAYHKRDCDGSLYWEYGTRYWNDFGDFGDWNADQTIYPVIAWQKIEPYKEKEDGCID